MIEAAQRERNPVLEEAVTAGEQTKLTDRGMPSADEVEVDGGIAYFYLSDDTFVMTMTEAQWTALQAE